MDQESEVKTQLKDEVYSRQQYAKANFWDERYAEKGGMFDWYAQYPELKHSFTEYDLKLTDRILMVGCGNSKLSDQMWQAGYKNIVNIDISPAVIEQMRKQFPQMVWQVMDATKMSYMTGQFDAILDKGTLDALISGKNYEICQQMLRECMRVTKENGQVLLITYGSPEGRRKIFQPVYSFHQYDYYQCRAELNDMSTMINLMRSNVGAHGLKHIIQDQVAFAKTMKEFSIVKFLRSRRKNNKQFIVWNQMAKKELQVNTGFQKIKQTQKPQVIKGKEQVVVETKKEETLNYDPQKQSYVWVYSVRRKLVMDIQKAIGTETEQQLEAEFTVNNRECTIEGDHQLPPVTIYLPAHCLSEGLRAVKYLKTKKVAYPTVKMAPIGSSPLNNSLRVSLVDLGQSQRKMMVLKKTNLLLKFKIGEKVSLPLVLQEWRKVSRKLVTQCNLYPCPKTYALFHVLKSRMGIVTVNSLMQKYWFPTFKVVSVVEGEVLLKLSLPPVMKQKQKEILSTLPKLLKLSKPEIVNNQPGCVSYFDLTLSNIVGLACLSYSGAKLNLIVEDFWEDDQFGIEGVKNEGLYNWLPNTIAVPKELMMKSIVHILALY